MKNFSNFIIAGALSLTVTSCYVSSLAVTDQNPGEVYVNYYPYYFCPEQDFYFNPDLNVYWWHQGGVWYSGAQLPYNYHINYNTNYVIVTVHDRNPTRYYSQHLREYQRGGYVQVTYHAGERPMQSLRSYRPERTAGSRSDSYYRSDDIYAPRRTPNYDNKKNRSYTPQQYNGSRSGASQQKDVPSDRQNNSYAQPQGTRTENSGRYDSRATYNNRQNTQSNSPSQTETRQRNNANGNYTSGSEGSRRESRPQQPAENNRSRQQTTNPEQQLPGRSSQVNRQEGSRSSSNDQNNSSRRNRSDENQKRSDDTN